MFFMIKKHPRLVCSWTDYWGLTQYPPIKAQEREPQRVPVYSICAHQCLSSKAQTLLQQSNSEEASQK